MTKTKHLAKKVCRITRAPLPRSDKRIPIHNLLRLQRVFRRKTVPGRIQPLSPRSPTGITGRVVKSLLKAKNSAKLKWAKNKRTRKTTSVNQSASTSANSREPEEEPQSEDHSSQDSTSNVTSFSQSETASTIPTESESSSEVQGEINMKFLPSQSLTSPLLLYWAHVENNALVEPMDSALYQMSSDPMVAEAQKPTENTPKAYLFKHHKKSHALLLLRHPTSLLIEGQISAQVLLGEVEVHGHTMAPGDEEWVPIHSSSSMGFLPLVTMPSRPPKSWERELKTSLAALQMDDMLGPLRQYLDPLCTLVALKRYMTTGALNKSAMRLFPSQVQLMKNLQINLVKVNSDLRVISQSSHQKELTSSMLQDARIMGSQGRRPVIVVCGGRGLGKSTYLRYLVNRLLAEYEYIHHLDMDPGQPEFTLPGCLSLSRLSKPLLGPPFTHLRQPVKCIYLGQVDISKVGSTYLNGLKSLHSHYDGSAPLVVNTMGWTSGLGLQLLVDILRYIEPTHVMQLYIQDDRDGSSNLPDLTPEYLQTATGWASSIKPCHYTLLKTLGRVPKMRYTSQELRDLRICYYLDRLSHTSLLNMDLWTCYQVPWSTLVACFCHEVVPPSQIMQVLNGSLVALCMVDQSVLQRAVQHDKSLPAILPGCPENQCLGYGIVMRLDLASQTLCIATPEILEVLSQVNALYRGQVTLPDHLLLRQSDGARPLPYVNKVACWPKFKSLTYPVKKQGSTLKTKTNL